MLFVLHLIDNPGEHIYTQFNPLSRIVPCFNILFCLTQDRFTRQEESALALNGLIHNQEQLRKMQLRVFWLQVPG
jgi:hypothetical protein